VVGDAKNAATGCTGFARTVTITCFEFVPYLFFRDFLLFSGLVFANHAKQ
jgi:hypothetical protein